MAIDYAALATELNTDPQTYGYSGHIATGNDTELAALLNKLRDGTDGETAITVRRPDIQSAEVLEAIDSRDFSPTPHPAHVAWFESATQLRVIRLENADGTATRALGNINRLLENPGPQGSRARVQAIANRVGSRAEQLFGANTVITPADIARALRG